MDNLIYTLRPSGTSLWLPRQLMKEMGLRHGDQLTAAQFEDQRITWLLADRLASEGKGKKR